MVYSVWVPQSWAIKYLRVIRQDRFTIYDVMPSHFPQCTSPTVVISWFSPKTHY